MAKYATATNATIALDQLEGHVTFRVTDDGAGFDLALTSYGTGLARHGRPAGRGRR